MSSNAATGKRQPYLLVLDLPEMMEAYERADLQIPDVSFFKQRQERLAAKIQEAVPDCSLEVIEANKLVNKIAGVIHDLLRVTPEAVVVSTMRNVASQMGGHCLQINRLVDFSGKAIGLGARPGHGSIRSQLVEIKNLIEKRPIILVEDGSFSGSTIASMLRICEDLRIEVRHLAIGILFRNARTAIAQVFKRERDIRFWREEDFLDWMPDHDFFAFVPNAGRVVGLSYNCHPMPVYLHNGLSLTMPYVFPYGKPTEWASIPAENACKLSLFCLRETIAIFEEMEMLNGGKVTLDRLIGTYPRVGVPVSAGEKEFPHIDTRILDILHDDVQLLA